MERSTLTRDRRVQLVVVACAVLQLAVGLFTIRQYGYFRDELYYLACTRHLAFGYVDQPPLSIALLRLVRVFGGDSLVGLRVVPLLAGVAVIALTGRLVVRLGGGALAAALACFAVVGAPVLLAFHHRYSMNALDGVFWLAAALLLARAVESRRLGAWAWLGVVLGLGLENKLSVLWLGAGVALALVLFDRPALRTRGPYVAAAIAAALFLPHLVWQVVNGLPTVEFMRNALQLKYRERSFLGFLAEVVLVMNPAALPIWAVGLTAPFVTRPRGTARILACVALTAFAIVAATRSGKAEYLAAVIPIPLALGACAIERWSTTPVRTAGVALLGAGIVGMAILVAPFAVPVLPVERFIAYQRALGMTPSSSEKKELAELPQGYADMFGWTELVDVVADAVPHLSPAERERAVIWTVSGGYGSAAALEILGRERGLPPVISGHNNYWLWGPGRYDGSVAIVVGGRREQIAPYFESLEQTGVVECGLCMPYENHKPVYIARGLRAPLARVWAEEKSFN
ncbi:glycosyltransferase family 39 protein [Sorangium sp. So ce291]|uniref:glycosyltransferase family 39 protein n=1 Tax=Sorangium sp. So ce291 TaxID=3133294 RepID=UPI003F6293FE